MSHQPNCLAYSGSGKCNCTYSMTNTIEKLQAIRAKCVELLAIAEKRTPGEWNQDHIYVGTNDKADFIKADGNPNNATFIASCAGPAEAGWRATVAAIDMLANLPPQYCPKETTAILAAWEGFA